MKKVRLTAMLLCMFVIINACTSVGYASADEILAQLGIMTAAGDSHIVSKGEFAGGLARITGAKPLYSGKSRFEDLTEDSTYYAEIMILADLGIICGDENGKIEADMPVTFNQAVKMLICLLGYEDYAQIHGGYPMGYITVAKRIGLLDGLQLKNEGWLEEYEAEKLLYQALYAPVLNITAISSDGSVSYDNRNENTLLYMYRGLTGDKGVVTAVPFYEKASDKPLGENGLCIDGEVYTYKSADASLMGKQVEFFYDEDRNIAALSLTDKNQSVEFSFDDIKAVNEGEIVYLDENGREKQLSMRVDTEVLYNCEPLGSALNIDFKNTEGYVTAVSNDGDGDYDYIFIDSYEDFLVGSVDRIKKIIYDKNSKSNYLDLSGSDGKEVKITDEFGSEIAIDEIVQDYLFTVRKSGESLKFYLCEDDVVGTVKQLRSNGKIVIDGTEYSKAKYFDKYYSVEIGDSGRFLINNYGKIAAFVSDSGAAVKYGYLIAAGKEGSLSVTYRYKILGEDGKTVVLNCAEKAEYNGEGRRSAESVYNALCGSGSSPNRQIIRYGVNKSGELNYIETAETSGDADDRLKLIASLSNVPYVVSTGIYGGKVVIGNNTLLFCIPNTAEAYDENDYCVTKATSYLMANTNYSMKAYRVGDNDIEADVMVLERSFDSTALSATAPVGVFDERVSAINKNGETVEQIAVYTETGRRVMTVRHAEQLDELTDSNGMPYTLKCGDVIRYSYDSISGEVRTLALLYSRETGDLKGNAAVNSWNSSFHYNLGYAYKTMGEYLMLSSDVPTEATDISGLHLYKMGNIVVYDAENDKLIKGGTADMMDYISTGRTTRVFVQTSYSATKLMYVIYQQ